MDQLTHRNRNARGWVRAAASSLLSRIGNKGTRLRRGAALGPGATMVIAPEGQRVPPSAATAAFGEAFDGNSNRREQHPRLWFLVLPPARKSEACGGTR